MTFSDIALDEFASGSKWESTIHATMVIVSICLLLSIILFLTRLYQVIQENMEQDNRSITIQLFQITHLLAMFSSCFYLFLYEWNYSNWYTKINPMDCGIWYEMIMLSITISKVFTYSFLMLRSTISFSSSFFRIPLKISIPIIILSCTSQLTMMGLMISDYTPISPFPFNGFCFRTLGQNGVAGIAGFNFSDAISGFVAIVIFWWKSKQVKAFFGNMEKIDPELMELKEVFRKHIFFGMLIFMGSMLIFFAGEFLTVLMGVASALHQLMNNIYIFLLFKQNIPIYNRLCCRFKAIHKQNDAVKLTEGQIDNKRIDNNDDDNKHIDNNNNDEGRYKWREFNATNTMFDAHNHHIAEKRGSLRSQSSFEITPYKPYNNNMMIAITKKSNSYTDLKKLNKKKGVGNNGDIKLMNIQSMQSMSTPMMVTPIHLTPMFNGDNGGDIKLMNIPTQSSIPDVSHTVPAYQLYDV